MTTSPSSIWKTAFLSSLEERDAREKAHDEFITAYYRLATRMTSLSAPAPASSSPHPAATTPTQVDELSQIKHDLLTAQSSKTQLNTKLKALSSDLEKLTIKNKKDNSDLELALSEKIKFERRTKDLEEELKEKSRLIQNLEDEILAFEIQLNVATEKKSAVERENKELVERLMLWKANEAEQMNRLSKWE
ncbi:autophagy protein 16, interacts with Atg12p-Atg5p [Rhizina undulata]